MTPDIGAAPISNYPSTEQVFSDAEAPGLFEQPNFLHTTFFADVDYRDERGNAAQRRLLSRGDGILERRHPRSLRLQALRRNLLAVPCRSTPGKKHVLLGRFGVSYANNETGSRVPFYFLPYVGGVDTIRSFREFRFKDENALWMSGRIQLALMKFLSVAAFADAGKVAPDWQDIRA